MSIPNFSNPGVLTGASRCLHQTCFCYFALAPKLKIDISPLKVKNIFLAIFVSNKALFLEYFIFDNFFGVSVKIKKLFSL